VKFYTADGMGGAARFIGPADVACDGGQPVHRRRRWDGSQRGGLDRLLVPGVDEGAFPQIGAASVSNFNGRTLRLVVSALTPAGSTQPMQVRTD
jgi:hypothetical protein